MLEHLNVDTTKKSPHFLPFGRRDGFIELLKEKGVKRMVEIGTYRGKYAENLLNGIPDLKLYCVDPWVHYKTYEDYGHTGDLIDAHKEAKDRLSKYPNCEIIRAWSHEAVNYFEDESLDAVFIDGNHALEFVIDDIAKWSKKVKKGGIISGHDYFRGHGKNLMHVKDAVNTYTYVYKINPFFVTTKDKCPTFFWVK